MWAEITLAGFVVVAIIAIGLMLFARHDKLRSIRFGFFFEHERTPEEEEVDPDGATKVMWPLERGEKERQE